MANRHNHYEAAFEAYLRERGAPYVAVDEARRSLLPGSLDSERSIKSLDFIVSSPGEPVWLLDIKGRRFPSGRRRQYWKNWSTQDDLKSLARWQQLFGPRAQAGFVFAYAIEGGVAPLPVDELFAFREVVYAFVAIRLDAYAAWARPISRRWDTLAMPGAMFRRLAGSCAQLMNLPQPVMRTRAAS